MYLDENALDRGLVLALEQAGFDVLTTSEAGMRQQPDERQLEYASDTGRVLFTNNARDFRLIDRKWASSGRHHAGIIILSDQLAPIGVQLRCLQVMQAQFSADDMRDNVFFVLNFADRT